MHVASLCDTVRESEEACVMCVMLDRAADYRSMACLFDTPRAGNNLEVSFFWLSQCTWTC